MIFTFTDEQNELAATLRRFLQDKSPSSEVRRLMATEQGYDPPCAYSPGQEAATMAIDIATNAAK